MLSDTITGKRKGTMVFLFAKKVKACDITPLTPFPIKKNESGLRNQNRIGVLNV